MFTNKAPGGRNNLCGRNVADMRKKLGLSQRALADRLQINDVDVDKNAIQRIESGQRFVTDIEIVALSKSLGVSLDLLLSPYSIIVK